MNIDEVDPVTHHELVSRKQLYAEVTNESVGRLSEQEAAIAAISLVEAGSGLTVPELAAHAFATFGDGHDWHTLIRAAVTARAVVA